MYSPGICPMGYTDGCALPTALASMLSGTPQYGGPLLADETARVCCPTSYTCFTGPGASPDIPYSKCISAGHSSRTFVESQVTHTTRNMAYAIQVRWQSSDLSNFETDPTVPGSTFSGPTATSTTTPNDDGTGSHLPWNIILAIVIGLILFAALLGIVGWLVWRRHFWKQQVIHRETASTQDLLKGGEANSDHAMADRELQSLTQPAAAFSRPATGLSGYMVSPLTHAVSEMNADVLPCVHEAPASARQPMELEVLEEARELPASMSFAPVELEGSMPAAWVPPVPCQFLVTTSRELPDRIITIAKLRPITNGRMLLTILNTQIYVIK